MKIILSLLLLISLNSCKSKPKVNNVVIDNIEGDQTVTIDMDKDGIWIDSVSRKPESALDSAFYYLDKETDAQSYDSTHYWNLKLQAYCKKIKR